jgi:N-acetylglutamate synthase-like GNAT family acetyltransferase
MNNIIIRKVRKEDLLAIAEAFKKAYLPLFKFQKLSKTTISEQFSLNNTEHLLLRIRGNNFYVAEDLRNNRIVGLIGLRKDDNSDIHNRISTFFVLPKYQKKGIGSLLFKKIIYLTKQFNVKKLVVSSSLFAEDIYEHWGFKKIKNLKKKYSNGDVYKNVWMEKTIS